MTGTPYKVTIILRLQTSLLNHFYHLMLFTFKYIACLLSLELYSLKTTIFKHSKSKYVCSWTLFSLPCSCFGIYFWQQNILQEQKKEMKVFMELLEPPFFN